MLERNGGNEALFFYCVSCRSSVFIHLVQREMSPLPGA